MRKSEDPRYAWADGPRNEAGEGKPIPVATNQPELFPAPGYMVTNEQLALIDQDIKSKMIVDGNGILATKITPQAIARPDSNPKSAFGIKKPSMHLIPGTALMFLAKVMALGAAKYGAHNWRDQPVAATVYISAALRHIFQWLDGEDIDPESGAPHLAHAMADTAILLDAMAHGTMIDDRPAKGKTSEVIQQLTVKD